MRLDRLFNVLVLGGAAVVATACEKDSNQPDDDVASVSESGSEDSGEEGGQSSSGDTSSGGSTTDVSTGEAESTATGTSTATDTAANEETGDPACLENPPPCGCPCCWVPDCNTDEACCAGWCGECC